MKNKSKTTQKNNLDQFYTKENIAIECIKLLNLLLYDNIIEPSAGKGAFSKNIKHTNLIALDIDPKYNNIIKQNWLTYIPEKYNSVLIIGNPPFGIRNKVTNKFINKALMIPGVKTIAFILPDVFNKHTMQKIFPKEWRLIKIYKLPKDSFILDDQAYHVPCTFFIWDKSSGEDLRFNPDLYKECRDFKFCEKIEADFFIMGASPHVIKNIKDVTKNNRGYYIKCKVNKEQVSNKFKEKKWIGHSSVNGGANWFTKPEIIKGYGEII